MVPLWAPGAQIPMGSSGKLQAAGTPEFSHWRGERAGIYHELRGDFRVGGASACPVQRQGGLGPPEEALGSEGSWALCSKAGVWAPPGPCLRAREPGKVSDFIPPPGKHGLVKRGFPQPPKCVHKAQRMTNDNSFRWHL